MKRIHVNLHVSELAQNITFYTQLFQADPTVQKADYVKWMLDDPRINFSISLVKKGEEGLEHLGIEAENKQELQELFQRLDTLEGKQLAEGDTVCCYAKSEKSWVEDPQGISWEIFHTYGASEAYREPSSATHSACCSQ